MDDFNKLTEKAQAAIIRAQAIAREHSASEIDGEQLLAALLEDEEGVPATVLRQIGVDVSALQRTVSETLGKRAKVYGGSEPALGRESAQHPRACRSRGGEFQGRLHLDRASAARHRGFRTPSRKWPGSWRRSAQSGRRSYERSRRCAAASA